MRCTFGQSEVMRCESMDGYSRKQALALNIMKYKNAKTEVLKIDV